MMKRQDLACGGYIQWFALKSKQGKDSRGVCYKQCFPVDKILQKGVFLIPVVNMPLIKVLPWNIGL